MRWLGEVPEFGGIKTSGAGAADQCRPWPRYKRYPHFQPTNISERKHHNYIIGIQFLTSSTEYGIYLPMIKAPKISSSSFFCIRQKFSLSDVAAKSAAHQTSEGRSRPHDLVRPTVIIEVPPRINQHSNPSCPSTLVSTVSAASVRDE